MTFRGIRKGLLNIDSGNEKIALMAAESVCEERANLEANSKTGVEEREVAGLQKNYQLTKALLKMSSASCSLMVAMSWVSTD